LEQQNNLGQRRLLRRLVVQLLRVLLRLRFLLLLINLLLHLAVLLQQALLAFLAGWLAGGAHFPAPPSRGWLGAQGLPVDSPQMRSSFLRSTASSD
jgi:hypothetical protein